MFERGFREMFERGESERGRGERRERRGERLRQYLKYTFHVITHQEILLSPQRTLDSPFPNYILSILDIS